MRHVEERAEEGQGAGAGGEAGGLPALEVEQVQEDGGQEQQEAGQGEVVPQHGWRLVSCGGGCCTWQTDLALLLPDKERFLYVDSQRLDTHVIVLLCVNEN